MSANAADGCGDSYVLVCELLGVAVATNATDAAVVDRQATTANIVPYNPAESAPQRATGGQVIEINDSDFRAYGWGLLKLPAHAFRRRLAQPLDRDARPRSRRQRGGDRSSARCGQSSIALAGRQAFRRIQAPFRNTCKRWAERAACTKGCAASCCSVAAIPGIKSQPVVRAAPVSSHPLESTAT